MQLGGSKAAQAAQELRGAREAEAAVKEKAKEDAKTAAAREKDDEENRKKADKYVLRLCLHHLWHFLSIHDLLNHSRTATEVRATNESTRSCIIHRCGLQM